MSLRMKAVIGVLADAGLLCDKAAMLRDTTNGTVSTVSHKVIANNNVFKSTQLCLVLTLLPEK
jgi:hypothetical protein